MPIFIAYKYQTYIDVRFLILLTVNNVDAKKAIEYHCINNISQAITCVAQLTRPQCMHNPLINIIKFYA